MNWSISGYWMLWVGSDWNWCIYPSSAGLREILSISKVFTYLCFCHCLESLHMICPCSKKLVILTKRVLNLPNLFMLIKEESLILIFVFSLLSRTNLKLSNIIATPRYTKIKKLQLISLRRLDLFVFPWFFRTLSLSFHLQMIVFIWKNFVFQIATKTLSRLCV